MERLCKFPLPIISKNNNNNNLKLLFLDFGIMFQKLTNQ